MASELLDRFRLKQMLNVGEVDHPVGVESLGRVIEWPDMGVEVSARPKDAQALRKRLIWIGNMLERALRIDTVKGSIRTCQLLRIHHLELYF